MKNNIVFQELPEMRVSDMMLLNEEIIYLKMQIILKLIYLIQFHYDTLELYISKLIYSLQKKKMFKFYVER